jgi:hypothetical protein
MKNWAGLDLNLIMSLISHGFVWPYVELGLDKTDSLGVGAAVQRLYFSKRINAISSLRPNDPFRRTWVDLNGRVAVRSEA